MGLLNFFKRTQTKTFAPSPLNTNTNAVRGLYDQQTILFMLFNDREFIQFYENVAPCSDAIDFVAETSSNIKMKIKEDSEFVENQEVQQILDMPNVVQTWHQVYLALTTFFLITGNAYLCTLRGSLGQLLEVFILEPQHISLDTDNTFFVRTYWYNNGRGIGRLAFQRTELDGKIRYFTEDGTKELYHLKRFNAHDQQTLVTGTSKLRSIVYELAQDQAGSMHNLSILKNGARVGGIIKLKDDMTPDEQASVITQFENKFTGARNAGRDLISSAIDSYINAMQSNKDMDFQNLKTAITERIYQRYKIPLALIQSTSLSLANMVEANFQLYHNTVCPLTAQIYQFLTNIFRNYFQSFENQHFDYDPFAIDSLRFRRLQELQMQAALNVSSDNELRNQIDLPPYAQGNDIYKPATLIPVGDTTASNDAQ